MQCPTVSETVPINTKTPNIPRTCSGFQKYSKMPLTCTGHDVQRMFSAENFNWVNLSVKYERLKCLVHVKGRRLSIKGQAKILDVILEARRVATYV